MKKIWITIITATFALLCLTVMADVPKERIIAFMAKNKIKKFVRKAGSEEIAIKELVALTLPDTILNSNKDLLWRANKSGRITEMDFYASRKMQALYWIIKIYLRHYSNIREKEFCVFLDDLGNAIWDYKDLDEDKKAYYYKVILPSPTNHKDYFDRLGYVRIHDEALNQLETAFDKWYEEMKMQGLEVMRQNGKAPISASRYRFE